MSSLNPYSLPETQRPPFNQTSQAERLIDPPLRDVTRSYTKGRAVHPREMTFPPLPKPPQILQQFGFHGYNEDKKFLYGLQLEENWILNTGIWDDTKYWSDDMNWRDA